jgi:hypothetical protein
MSAPTLSQWPVEPTLVPLRKPQKVQNGFNGLDTGATSSIPTQIQDRTAIPRASLENVPLFLALLARLTRTCREQQFARMILIVLSIHQSKRALPTQMQKMKANAFTTRISGTLNMLHYAPRYLYFNSFAFPTVNPSQRND